MTGQASQSLNLKHPARWHLSPLRYRLRRELPLAVHFGECFGEPDRAPANFFEFVDYCAHPLHCKHSLQLGARTFGVRARGSCAKSLAS